MKRKDENQMPLTPLMSSIKAWIKKPMNDIAKALIGNAKSNPRFPELMHAAVFYGNLEIVKFLEAQGCSLSSVPKSIPVPENDTTDETAVKYGRKRRI